MTDALVVTPKFPWPLDSGSKIREFYTIRALSDEYDVSLVSLNPAGVSEDGARVLEDMGVEFEVVEHYRSTLQSLLRFATSRDPYRVSKFRNDEFRRLLAERVSESYDLVWVHFLESLVELPTDIEATVVLDQHNAETKYWQSFLEGSPHERVFARLNIRRLRRIQRQQADAIDLLLSVDESDAESAREWVTDAPVWVAPNGVDVDEFRSETPASESERRAVFVGSLGVRMNQEAVRWFAKEIWPDVVGRVPEARFDIVGKGAPESIRTLGDRDGVEFVGEVESVVEYYDRAALSVAPFLFGGGTKIKVLQSLAMERPFVATRIGVKGIEVQDGRHGFVVERGTGFADKVVELLERPSLRDDFGARGRELAENRYSWEAIFADTIDRYRAEIGRD